MTAKRFFAASALAVVLGLLSCVDGDSPTGIESAGVARLAVIPTIAEGVLSTAAVAQPVNRIRVTARKSTDGTVLVVHQQDVNPNAAEWALEIEIPVPDDGAQVVLTIELIHVASGTETVEWSGRSAPVTLTAGQSTEARSVQVSRGPTSNLAVTDVTVTPDTATLEEGDTLRLTASVSTSAQASPTVFWGSLDDNASVDDAGLVTALLPGQARLVAEAGAHADTTVITVSALPDGVVVSPDSVVAASRDTVVTFSASVVDARGDAIEGQEIQWASRDTTRVESLGEGAFRAFGAGRAWIEARAASDTALVDSALVVVVAPEADLAITKSADVTDIAPGDTLTYTITVVNQGPDSAGAFRVVDFAPEALAPLDDAVTTGTSVLDSLLWRVGGLAADAQATWTVRFVVGAGVVTEPLLFNTAEIDAAETFDPDPDNNETIHQLNVIQGVELSVLKTASDDNPFVGSQVTFEVVVENYGPRLATDVRIQDDADPGIASVVSSSTTRGSFDANTRLWTLDSIPQDHADTLTLVVQVDAGTAGQSLTNRAYSTGPTAALDLDSSNDTATAVVAPVQRQADIHVEKTVDVFDPLEGDTIMFRIVVDNFGPEMAREVRIQEAPDSALDHFLEVALTAGGADTATGVWLVDSIPPGTADTLTLWTVVDSGTVGDTLWNRATLVSFTGADDPDLTNNADSVQVVPAQREADLSLSKTVSESTPFEGDSLVFTVVVDNFGPDTARAVQVGDSADVPGFRVDTLLLSRGSFDTLTGIWTVGDIAPGASDTFRIVARADTGVVGDTIWNRAVAWSMGQVELDSTNNADSASFVVQPREADLNVTKTVDDANPFAGDTVKFTIAVENWGPHTATGIQIQELPDTGVAEVVGHGLTAGTVDSLSGIWSLDSIPAGGGDTLWLEVVVDSVAQGDTVYNAVKSLGLTDQIDPDASNDVDSVEVVVGVRTANLAINKFVDASSPFEGDTLTYKVELENWGGHVARNIQVFDSLDVGLVLVKDSATQGSFDGGTGIWTVDSLAPGDGDTLFLKVAVDSGTVTDTLWNRAGAFALTNAQESDPSNDTISVSVVVTEAPPQTLTWVGGHASDPTGWTVAANWSPAGVPRPVDDVHVVTAASNPKLSAADTVKNLTVDDGATLDLNGFDLVVEGSLSAGTTIVGAAKVIMTGAGVTLSGTLSNLSVHGDVSLDGTTHVTGHADVSNGGKLSVGANALTVDSTFTVRVGSAPATGLFMGDAGGTVTTKGLLSFEADGTNTGEGALTAGTLHVEGGFAQKRADGGHTGGAFVSTGTSVVFQGSTAQTATFDTPGAADSRFAGMTVASGATVSMGTDAFADAVTLSGALTVPGTESLAVTNVFTLGATGLLGVDGAVTASSCTDQGGIVTGSGTQPCGSALTYGKVWLGNSADWNTASNWLPSGVPTSTDDVLVQSGKANDPTLSAAGATRNILVESGATVTQGGNTLSVYGDLSADGTVSGGLTHVLGGGTELKGNLHDLTLGFDRTASGALTLTGSLVLDGRDLSLSNDTVNVLGDFTLTGSGAQLDMGNAGDVLDVEGDVTFGGGSHNGWLTNGTLYVGGDFTVLTSHSSQSFYGATAHTTVFDGTAAQTVSMGNPGISGTRFRHVTFDNPTTVTLASNLAVDGTATVSQGTVDGATRRLTLRGSLVDDGKDLDLAQLHLDADVSALPDTLTADSVYVDRNVDWPGSTVHTGHLTVTADLSLSNDTVKVLGDLRLTTSSAQIGMTHAGDVMDVEGDATFEGGGHNGWLTNGTLYVAGDFTVLTSHSSQSFYGSTAHTTVFDGTAAQTVTMANPGISGTRFRHVTFDNPTTVTLASNLAVDGTATVSQGTVDGATRRLTLRGSLVDAGKDLDLAQLHLDADVSALPDTLIADSVYVDSNVNWPGSTVHTGHLTVTADLSLSNDTVKVLGDLRLTTSSAQIRMSNAGDVMDVEGDATFEGGSHSGWLTNGTLFVAGDFTVLTSHSSQSFYGSTAHTTVFDGTAAQTVTMANPGISGTRFRHVTFDNPTTVTLASNLAVDGTATVSQGTVDGATRRLTLRGSLVDDGKDLDLAQLHLDADVSALPDTLTADSVYVDRNVDWPGSTVHTGHLTVTADLTLSNDTVKVLGDLRLTTSSAQLSMGNAGDVMDVEGDATFEGGSHSGWLTNGTLFVAGDFTVLTSHSSQSFYGSTAHTTVFDGTATQTVTMANPGISGTRFRHVTFDNPTTVTLASNLAVDGTATVSQGTVDGATRRLTLRGSLVDDGKDLDLAQLHLDADVSALPDTLTADSVYVDRNVDWPGSTVHTGHLTVTADLTLSNDTVKVLGDLRLTTSSAQIRMSNAGDVMDVEGDATFEGGGHSGWLTNGTLFVAGDFTVLTSHSSQSFYGTSGHTTVFDGTAAQTVTMANPGISGTRFRHVTFDNPTTVTLASNLAVDGTATVSQGTVDGATRRLTLRGSLVDDGKDLDLAQLHLDADVSALPDTLTADSVYVDSDVNWPGSTVHTGHLTLTADLNLSNDTVKVLGDLRLTTSSAQLSMGNAADVMDVEGNVTFDGGSHAGWLTDGTLFVGGDFTTGSTHSSQAFYASGSHTVIMDSANPSVVVGAPSSQRFHNLTFQGASAVLNTDIYVYGLLYVDADAHTDFTGGNTIHVRGGFDITGSVFDDTQVNIDGGAPSTTTLSQVTFQSMDTSVTQLSVRLNGGTYSFGNLTFSTLPATGLYVYAESANATLLTVELPNSSPLDGNAYTDEADANAEVLWESEQAAQDQ